MEEKDVNKPKEYTQEEYYAVYNKLLKQFYSTKAHVCAVVILRAGRTINGPATDIRDIPPAPSTTSKFYTATLHLNKENYLERELVDTGKIMVRPTRKLLEVITLDMSKLNPDADEELIEYITHYESKVFKMVAMHVLAIMYFEIYEKYKEQKKGIRQKDISALMKFGKSNIWNALGFIEYNHFIKVSGKHGRSLLYAFTEEGKKYLDGIKEEFIKEQKGNSL